MSPAPNDNLLALLRSFHPELLLALGGPATNAAVTALDHSGHGRHGTWKNTPTTAAPVFPGLPLRSSLFVSASSQWVQTPSDAAYNITDFTLLALVHQATQGAVVLVMARDAGGATSNRFWSFGMASTNELRVTVFNLGTATSTTVTANTPLTAGPHFVGATFSGSPSTVAFYLDGKQDGASVTTRTLATSGTQPVTVGSQNPTSSAFFNGKVQVAAFLPSVLTETDFRRVWRAIRYRQYA